MSANFLSELTGSFSQPSAENPTVAMVEAAYRHHGLDWRYINCEVAPENLGAAVQGARAMGWVGFNCSTPHKVAVLEHLDGLGESARIIGAVNTVVRRGDRYEGENTDGRGFVESLAPVLDLPGKTVVLLGAGGAARAVAVELALAGVAHVTVLNRDPGRGQELAQLVNDKTQASADFVPWDRTFALSARTDLLVNATSIGLYPNVDICPDIDLGSLAASLVVADAIPNPPRTALIRAAEARGCTVLDGLSMLVNQGRIALRYWSGVEADARVMRDCLERVLDVTP
jgi:shikimate dehydrogenase